MSVIRIIEDVVTGMTYSVDKDGGALLRNFTVTGLDSVSGPTGTSQTLYLASLARDQVTGFVMPRIFQQHESIPGLFVQNLNFEPQGGISRTNVTAKLKYGWQSFGLGSVQVKITGTRNVLHATRDPVTGNLFVVTYTSPGAGQVGGAVGGGGGNAPAVFKIAGAPAAPVAPITGSNLVLFDISSYHLTLEVQRVEAGSPKQKAAAYVGRVNSDPGWQGVGGSRARLWICQSIEGSQIQNGYFNVTYVFEYAPEGHWQIGLYQDPNTHITPPDVYLAAGFKGPGGQALAPVGWAITAPGQIGGIGSGVYGYVPPAVPFAALNIPSV